MLLALAAAAALAAIALTVVSNRPQPVATMQVTLEPAERVLAVVGRVRPIELVEVRPVNPGQVIRLYHDEGDRVAAGQPLALMRAAVETAQAQAERARVEAARARAEEARQALSRVSRLFEAGFAARAALDEARAALRSAEAEVAAAAATARASSEREGEFVVRAPMDSIVLARPIDNGQVVTTTSTLFELGGLQGGEIEAEVDEAYGDAVRPGMTARVSPTGTRTVQTARVSEVSPRVDASTGGRLVRLRLEANHGLAPGRSVDVTIVVRPAEKLLLAPRQALVEPTVAPKVYVVGADGLVRERAVRIADWPSTHAIVEAGLSPGERIVLTPAETRPGARVRSVPAER